MTNEQKAFKDLIKPDWLGQGFAAPQWMVEQANKTSRSGGAVGKNAIVPKKIRELFKPECGLKMLDFGAGKDALHAKALRSEGYFVDAYEFGENSKKGLHIQGIHLSTYGVVYASNVLNVQADSGMMADTLYRVWMALKVGGVFVANFPLSPRKNDIEAKDLLEFIESMFGKVEVFKGGKAPLFMAIKKR